MVSYSTEVAGTDDAGALDRQQRDNLVVGTHVVREPVRQDDRPSTGSTILQIAHRENTRINRLHMLPLSRPSGIVGLRPGSEGGDGRGGEGLGVLRDARQVQEVVHAGQHLQARTAGPGGG